MKHVFIRNSRNYHQVRKVRVTHIILDRRTTMIAFIECTELR